MTDKQVPVIYYDPTGDELPEGSIILPLADDETIRERMNRLGPESWHMRGAEIFPNLRQKNPVEEPYRIIDRPEDVMDGDVAFTTSGNRYPVQMTIPLRRMICCVNPDDVDRSSFPLPFDRFDYALRYKPVNGRLPIDPIMGWRPTTDRKCPSCGATDHWRLEGVLRKRKKNGRLKWRVTWQCRCGTRIHTYPADYTRELH